MESTLTTTTGAKIVSPTQTGAARVLVPGQYYVAITWNGAGSSTQKIGAASVGASGVVKGTGFLTSGGGLVLPSSITISSINNSTSLWGVGLNN